MGLSLLVDFSAFRRECAGDVEVMDKNGQDVDIPFIFAAFPFVSECEFRFVRPRRSPDAACAGPVISNTATAREAAAAVEGADADSAPLQESRLVASGAYVVAEEVGEDERVREFVLW